MARARLTPVTKSSLRMTRILPLEVFGTPVRA
jgi:hypothetical protein